MKITVEQLKQLIKEEVKKLDEQRQGEPAPTTAPRPILSREEMASITEWRSGIQAILQRIITTEDRLGGANNARALRTHIANLVAMENDLHDRFRV